MAIGSLLPAGVFRQKLAASVAGVTCMLLIGLYSNTSVAFRKLVSAAAAK